MKYSVQEIKQPYCELGTIHPGKCFEYEDKTYLKTDELNGTDSADAEQRVAVVCLEGGMVYWMLLDVLVKPLKQKQRMIFTYDHEQG